MTDVWEYYEGIDRRFEYAEKLAGKPKFFGDDLRKALVDAIVYGFDISVAPDGTMTASRQLNEPSGPIMRQLNRHSYQVSWLDEVQRIIDKTDDLHRLAAAWRTVPPAPPRPEIAGIRWTCKDPGAGSYHRQRMDLHAAAAITEPHRQPFGGNILDLLITAKQGTR